MKQIGRLQAMLSDSVSVSVLFDWPVLEQILSRRWCRTTHGAVFFVFTEAGGATAKLDELAVSPEMKEHIDVTAIDVNAIALELF